MSEKINPDLQSLTPEEAFSPELRQQNAEWQAYVDSRPFEDSNGRLRSPNGQFVSAATYDRARDTHYEETLGDTYEDLSVSELADDLAWAEVHGDTTVSGDMTDVLMDKMIDFAEKNDMDSDAQTNLYNRVLKLVDNHKERYLSHPESLDLTNTERKKLEQGDDSSDHEPSHIHDSEHDSSDHDHSQHAHEETGSDAKEQDGEDTIEGLQARAEEQLEELKAVAEDMAGLRSDSKAETDSSSEEDEATQNRGSRLKRLLGRMRNWKSTLRALNAPAGVHSYTDEEEPDRLKPVKPKRRIISTTDTDSKNESSAEQPEEEQTTIEDGGQEADTGKPDEGSTDLETEEDQRSVTERLTEEYSENPNAGSVNNVARRIVDEETGEDVRPPLTEAQERAKRIVAEAIEAHEQKLNNVISGQSAELDLGDDEEGPAIEENVSDQADSVQDKASEKNQQLNQVEVSDSQREAIRDQLQRENPDNPNAGSIGNIARYIVDTSSGVEPRPPLTEAQEIARRLRQEAEADHDTQDNPK